ncbi:MAG TPA: polymer-forming cytoskeletal protein [Thermodesulfobacteriota bacterium]|jgi:cytoskeletal protein CcmA (bactofilin family)|nr:polymer-forming cytoskeletal protein [Thermodesulfobacteriota bacterium]
MGILNKKKSSSDITQTVSDYMSSDVITLIGQGCIFEGNLTSPTSTRLDGTIKGNIDSQGTLVVGEGGIISGEVKAAEISVHGRVEGNIHSEKLIIKSGGIVVGDINSKSFIIEDGGIYNGKCLMQSSSYNGSAESADSSYEADSPNS